MYFNWISLTTATQKKEKKHKLICFIIKIAQRATEILFTKLPHHTSDKFPMTSFYFVSSWLAKVNAKLVKANQTYMPSHRAFKSTISCSFGLILNHCFQLRTPLPSTCPPPSCSHNLPSSSAHTIPQCIWHREQPAGTEELRDTKISA